MRGEMTPDSAAHYEQVPNTFGGMSRDDALRFIEQTSGMYVRSIVEQYLLGVSMGDLASTRTVRPSFIEDVVNLSRRDVARKVSFDKNRVERARKLAGHIAKNSVSK